MKLPLHLARDFTRGTDSSYSPQLQAAGKALRIHQALIIKYVSGSPNRCKPVAESLAHCRFLIADCRFDLQRRKRVSLTDQSTIGNWQSAMSRDPLNLIRLTPSKGETVDCDRSVLFDEGNVFCPANFSLSLQLDFVDRRQTEVCRTFHHQCGIMISVADPAKPRK